MNNNSTSGRTLIEFSKTMESIRKWTYWREKMERGDKVIIIVPNAIKEEAQKYQIEKLGRNVEIHYTSIVDNVYLVDGELMP